MAMVTAMATAAIAVARAQNHSKSIGLTRHKMSIYDMSRHHFAREFYMQPVSCS